MLFAKAVVGASYLYNWCRSHGLVSLRALIRTLLHNVTHRFEPTTYFTYTHSIPDCPSLLQKLRYLSD